MSPIAQDLAEQALIEQGREEVRQAVLTLWNHLNGWIPGGAYSDLALTLDMNPALFLEIRKKNREPSITPQDKELKADKHGNQQAREGCDRCPCGAKYWENDVCVSCGAPFKTELPATDMTITFTDGSEVHTQHDAEVMVPRPLLPPASAGGPPMPECEGGSPKTQ
jgi:hypothetical protein